MDDFISREAALDFLIPAFDLNISVQDQRVIGERFVEFLERIPAADVRPVVRGTWIAYRPDCRPVTNWGCSNCEYDPDLNAKPHFDFCPNCGADMREVHTGG